MPDKAEQVQRILRRQDIYEASFELFRSLVGRLEKYFPLPGLASQLRTAHINVPAERWLAFSIFVGLLSLIASAMLVPFFAFVIYGFKLNALIFVLAIILITTVAGFVLTVFYPKIICSERQRKIENTLPFATLYMSTIARSGFPPQSIFKLLSGFKEYGEVSVEAAKIRNDVEALGLDLPSAVSRAMSRSPSPSWTELLAGLRTTMLIGGDLGAFLSERAKGAVAEYKRRLEDFSNFLSMLIEVYITVVVVGAIFFIIISSIMVAIGGVSVSTVKLINLLIVVFGLPLLTGGFILVIKSISPIEK
jgi:flagellar protein FlaJ